MSDSHIQNPYAQPVGAVELAPSDGDADASTDAKKRSWPASIAVWSLVCIISAIPSFVWGIGTVATQQAAAMIVGVVIFIAGYVFADQLTQGSSWRRNKSLRLALKIGYLTRLAISVIFPVGGLLDMTCGLFSISVVEFVSSVSLMEAHNMGAGTAGFGQILATTLVQGVVLNLVLAGFVVLVFGITLVVNRGAK